MEIRLWAYFFWLFKSWLRPKSVIRIWLIFRLLHTYHKFILIFARESWVRFIFNDNISLKAEREQNKAQKKRSKWLSLVQSKQMPPWTKKGCGRSFCFAIRKNHIFCPRCRKILTLKWQLFRCSCMLQQIILMMAAKRFEWFNKSIFAL